ncbi:response regulator [Candidatus Bathyarchaeota archaeon]|nr:response regulator [Candidatus Bathyarchaeota archaeon]
MKKVLIVDDSAFMRMILKEKVSSIGQTEILEASDGKQAIEIGKNQKLDLILLDVVLPGISGESVLSNLRKAGVETKVVMVTAVGQNSVIQRCEELGISGYIVKPFDDAKITKLIKTTCNMP